MRRFLGQWVIFGIIHAAVGSAIDIGIFHNVDLRFSTFAGFVLIPAFQSLVLMWTFPAGEKLRIGNLWPALIAFVVTAAVPVVYAPYLRALVALIAGLVLLTRKPLLGIALVVAAANVPFQWLAKLTPLLHAPTVWQWVAVYGGAFAIYVVIVLFTARDADIALIPAIAAAIVVSFNIFFHPHLKPLWSRIANALGAASFAMLVPAAFVSAGELVATIAVVVVVLPLWVLPWRMSCAVARAYGAIGFVVWGKARRAGMMNLRRALQMDEAQARRATFTVFANLGRSIAEGLQFVRRYRDDPEAWRKFCRIEHPELAERILSDPRPKIFVTSHLGSWEVATMIVDLAVGGRGAGIARRVDNRWLDALVKRVRLRDRAQWIEKHGAASEALRRLQNGQSIMMLLDENGGPRGPFVPFFGRLSSTRKTPAVLSMRTGAPIVVGAVVRDETKRQPAFIFKLALVEGVDGIVPITTRINDVLESWIRETPLQWRWIHWRWRTRPDGTEERYGRRELRACFAERP